MSLGRKTASNLVNKQFNSPIKLYSPESVQEALNKHTQALSNGAIGWAENSLWYSRTHETVIACYTNGLLCNLYSLCISVTMVKTGIIWIRHVARVGKRNQFERLRAMNSYRRLEAKFHSFMTSALYGGKWSASRQDASPPWKRFPGIYRIRGCLNCRTCLDYLEKRKISLTCQESNHDSSSGKHVA